MSGIIWHLFASVSMQCLKPSLTNGERSKEEATSHVFLDFPFHYYHVCILWFTHGGRVKGNIKFTPHWQEKTTLMLPYFLMYAAMFVHGVEHVGSLFRMIILYQRIVEQILRFLNAFANLIAVYLALVNTLVSRV